MKINDIPVIETDVLVIGGGTAGPMAAVTAKEQDPGLNVMLLEKANVKRSGAISMGMDGLNNAVVPGHATPEQYVKEITIANDGIVHQPALMAYATRSFPMIEKLDSWGVHFQKDETGDYDMKKVHHLGTYVLPMPEGHNVKKILYRRLRRNRVQIENRYTATRLLKDPDGKIAGMIGVNTRTAEPIIIRAKAVIMATGAAGRLGLPTSGYLFGTYENPANNGDGHAMAYHAGADLANLECFQVNPLLKDYNGPACAYVTGPLGGFTANAFGERFIECDYWSGQMMLEFFKELESGTGPVFLKLDHLAEETIQEIETVLHTNERPTRGRFHEGRDVNYRQRMVEMHISEVGFCCAGDMASVAHNYMLGAFVYGQICGESAVEFVKSRSEPELDEDFIIRELERIQAPMKRADGIPPEQMEYKVRRLVNDYLQPPKVTKKMEIGLERILAVREDVPQLCARDPHELLRAMEVQSIIDCAEMAARASLYRTESRWGLYHYRVDFPDQDDGEWFYHSRLFKDEDGQMASGKRPIADYLVSLGEEKDAYRKMRVQKAANE